jgi:hypothetical protein
MWMNNLMSYLDPNAQHSPSLVQNVDSGTRSIAKLWKTNVIQTMKDVANAVKISPMVSVLTSSAPAALSQKSAALAAAGAGGLSAAGSNGINITFNLETVPGRSELEKLVQDALSVRDRLLRRP